MKPQSESSADNPNTIANTAQRIGDLMPDVVKRLSDLSERAAKHRKDIELFAAKQPQFKSCPQGGSSHLIDVDATSRQHWADGKLEAVYSVCSKCRQGDESEWLKAAGVPSILINASFYNWKLRSDRDREILESVKTFAEGANGFLILSGTVGLGKSHLAVAVMRKRGCGRMITQNRLLMRVRERYHNQFAEDVVGKCKLSKLLVLDEIGFMTGGRDELPAIYEVLDYRHGERLPTILTTNIPVAQFDEAFGDRIADRLRCHQPFVVLRGESWRGQP